MVEFKIGDRIRIRQWNDMERDFGLDEDGFILTSRKNRIYFTPSMTHLCGRTAIITAIEKDKDKYKLNFNDKTGDVDWYYCAGMLELCDDEISELKNRIKYLEEKIRELGGNVLLEGNVLADYESTLNKNSCWVIDYTESDNIYQFANINNWLEYKENYAMYPSEEYAKTAYKMHKFNDMLLAFKWCHDRDYIPDWKDESVKYCVISKETCGGGRKYSIESGVHWNYNVVTFSTADIAQKCADWLNDIDADSEFIQ